MPVTFFDHQAPVLWLARRTHLHLDGVALIIGSMAPDFAYVLNGSRFSIWAHAVPWLIVLCVPATLLTSWVTVRVLAPVVPHHLPELSAQHLHDYRGLSIPSISPTRSSHATVWLPTVAGTLVGAV